MSSCSNLGRAGRAAAPRAAALREIPSSTAPLDARRQQGSGVEGAPEGFEDRLDAVVVVGHAQEVDVDVGFAVIGHGAEELGDQADGKVADGGLVEGRLQDQE